MRYTIWQKAKTPHGDETPIRTYLDADTEESALRLFKEDWLKEGYELIGEPRIKAFDQSDVDIPLGEEELSENQRYQRRILRALENTADHPAWIVATRISQLISWVSISNSIISACLIAILVLLVGIVLRL